MQQRVGIFFLLFIFSVNFLFGQSFRKYAGEFMYLGAGGKITGMAGAGTASANDVTAGFWNPAGLTGANGFQAEFMHSKQFISSIQNNYLGISQLNEDGSAFGLSVLYLSVSDIKDSQNFYDLETDDWDYSRVKYFSTGDYNFLLSYAKRYNSLLSYGFNLKLIYRDFYQENAFGFGFDAGLKFSPTERLQLGIVLRDFTSTLIAWSTGERELVTPSLRLGAAYQYYLPFWGLSLLPAMDLNILFENRRTDSQLNLGGMSLDSFWGTEIGYRDLFFIRAGLDDLMRFNTGVGLRIPKLTFDYAFTASQNELGNVQRISVHLQLENLF